MTAEQMFREAFFLWSGPAIVTALVSGIGLGLVFARIRPGVDPEAFAWGGTAICLLWYAPLTVQRFVDPALMVNAVRTIGSGILFECFILVAAVAVALRKRKARSPE